MDLWCDPSGFCVIMEKDNRTGFYADPDTYFTMPLAWARKAAKIATAGNRKQALHMMDMAERLITRRERT